MEAEGRMPSKDSNEENSRIHRSSNNRSLDTKPPSSSSFDCSVCLDFAVDPVVTLCGHLYCWPCIYKWLAIDSTCPVCKSSISKNRLIPLYGRDSNNNNNKGAAVTKRNRVENIPNRPRFMRNGMFDQQRLSSPMQYSTAGGVFMCLATSILPLLTRNTNGEGNMNFLRANQDGMIGYYSSENQRLHEREVENSLHQIWMFLFLCTVLWWLSF